MFWEAKHKLEQPGDKQAAGSCLVSEHREWKCYHFPVQEPDIEWVAAVGQHFIQDPHRDITNIKLHYQTGKQSSWSEQSSLAFQFPS